MKLLATTHRWLFGEGCCQFFAFLQQVFGVSQVAAVTMMAAERFVEARRFCCGKSACQGPYKFRICLLGPMKLPVFRCVTVA